MHNSAESIARGIGLRVRIMVHMLAAMLMALSAASTVGQDYPAKTIRIVTAEPGGGNDFVARLITQGIAGTLGQQVIVENRAGGTIASEIVSKAAPDGYTLLFYSGSIWIVPFLRGTTPFDATRDFAPITLTATSPNVLVVHPSVPVRTVKDLISLAKTRPGVLNYAAGSVGSAVHLAAELFNSMAGVDIVRIPYKGSGPAVIGLLSGQVELIFATPGSVASHIKSGKLRALAVTSARPSALFPGLVTVAASGLAGYEMVSIYGAFAPVKTPPPVVNRLNQEIARTLGRPDVKEKFLVSGVEAAASSPDEFVAIIKADMAKWGKVIKDAGIKGE